MAGVQVLTVANREKREQKRGEKRERKREQRENKKENKKENKDRVCRHADDSVSQKQQQQQQQQQQQHTACTLMHIHTAPASPPRTHAVPYNLMMPASAPTANTSPCWSKAAVAWHSSSSRPTQLAVRRSHSRTVLSKAVERNVSSLGDMHRLVTCNRGGIECHTVHMYTLQCTRNCTKQCTHIHSRAHT